MRELEASLQQFGEFILKAELVKEKAAPYCVRWVRRFLTRPASDELAARRLQAVSRAQRRSRPHVQVDRGRPAGSTGLWVSSDLAALNDLRNGVAHSFFPKNRRRKPEWKGQSVFTKAGFDRFLEDMQKLSDFFVERFWGGSPEHTGDRPDAALPNAHAEGA